MSPFRQALMLTSAALIIGIGVVGALSHQLHPTKPIAVIWETSGYGIN